MIDSEMFGYDGPLSDHVEKTWTASSSGSAGASRAAKQIEERHERLALVCMALWSLLMDKTNLTEQDLMDRVRLLDNMDGVADGKATRGITKCTNCGRTLNARHNKCLYCGHERLATSAFDRI